MKNKIGFVSCDNLLVRTSRSTEFCATISYSDHFAVVTAPAEKKSDPMVDGIDTTLGGIHRMSSRLSNKHRWSSRVLTNVVGEVENVIHKVHGDP